MNTEQPRIRGRWVSEGGFVHSKVDAFGEHDTHPRNGFHDGFGPWIRSVANQYNRANGLPEIDVWEPVRLTIPEGEAIAAYYLSAPDDPNSEVVAAYRALALETDAQFDCILNSGFVVERWTDAKMPYENSVEMELDVRINHHLYNPVKPETASCWSVEQNYRFRAVHDILGHSSSGWQFGPDGEQNAFLQHREMYSPLAHRAVATEILAASTTMNYEKFNQGKEPSQREWPSRKSVLIPIELYANLLSRHDAARNG